MSQRTAGAAFTLGTDSPPFAWLRGDDTWRRSADALASRPYPTTARVIATPAQAENAVRTVPHSTSVSTICQCQSRMIA